MRNALFLFFAQMRAFWRARVGISRLGFLGYRELFGIRRRIQEHWIRTKSLLALLRLTLGQLAIALLIAIGLQLTNPYLEPWFTALGFTIPTEGDYGTLLATITGVGGVFIGLYYTAISAIGGAIYARVPNNIRDLLAQDRVGNVYMRFLALLTYLGICLLAFHAGGLEPIVLAVPLFLVGAGLAIIAFVRLGARAFDLFDPTTLSYHLFEQLRRSYKQMQAGGYRWSDHAFQSHSHRLAQTAIDTLSTLSDITAQEPHLNARPFADLCKYLLSFLIDYETAKKSIPTDSLWYKKRYVHSDWYRTEDSTTSIVHATAASLQPQSVSDSRWIESEILPIVQRCLELNIRENRYTIVHEILDYLDAYIQRLATEDQVGFAFQLIREVSSCFEKLIFTIGDRIAAEESLDRMGICDQLATMQISALLAYIRATESYDRDSTMKRIHRIAWHSEKSIYRVGFHTHTLKQLEWLRPRLQFEEKVEGNIVSPTWYLQELINQPIAENFSGAMICFHDEARQLYEHWAKTATSSKHPWLAAVIISRESEYWYKLGCHTNTLDTLWNNLNADRRIDGLQWPELDFNELIRKKEERKKELLKLMSVENTLLSLIPRPESHPDFAGQFLHTVGEALLTAMYENDRSTVEALFKSYFHGSLMQYERLRPNRGEVDWRSQIKLKVAVAPLLDLMDISGYAFLFSDYHDVPKLTEAIVKEWDDYFDRESPTPPLHLLAAAVSLTESAFELAHRGVLRTRWKRIAVHRLNDVERRQVLRERGGAFTSSATVVIHKSPLVRIFAGERHGSFHDGIDVFLAKYARQREDGRDLDFGPRRRDLEESIRREEERYPVGEA